MKRQASRYTAAGGSIPKTCDFVILVLPQLEEEQIKQELRMTWTAFQQIRVLVFPLFPLF